MQFLISLLSFNVFGNFQNKIPFLFSTVIFLIMISISLPFDLKSTAENHKNGIMEYTANMAHMEKSVYSTVNHCNQVYSYPTVFFTLNCSSMCSGKTVNLIYGDLL